MPKTTPAPSGKSFLLQFIPVMLCFFAMGFVDLVGAASNYVQKDLGLTDTEANLFPSLVFFWFLIFSVPTGFLMNITGRKNTVLISLAVTAAALVVPMFGNSYYFMLIAFSLLGIGNAIMQTSLNPLVSNLINPTKLASTLTFGQFIKAIASFLAPIIMSWGAAVAVGWFGLGWRLVFVVYAVVCVLSIAALGATPIKEERPDKATGVLECVKLLANPFILLCFLGIMCHVGIDVGANTTAPKIIMERLGWELDDAIYATTVYFIGRTIGCFAGTFLLRVMRQNIFFFLSICIIAAGLGCLWLGATQFTLYAGAALVGFGNSNVFSVIFAQALNAQPNEKNEVSGLMIMGLFGGTLFPLAMGLASDVPAWGQSGAVAVMAVGAIYLFLYTLAIKKA